MAAFDRCWLLTWTTYGTWLPGDERGFVSNIDGGDGKGVRQNEAGSEPVAAHRGLQLFATHNLLGPPVYLTAGHAQPLQEQFIETAEFRRWTLLATAIMSNHIHALVCVPDDPEPWTLLRDFKSYGSRQLNKIAGKPRSETWWTEGGSTRKKADHDAILASIEYIKNQEYPLLIWLSPELDTLGLGDRGA